jgi:protein-tyrosine-phosphatase
MAAAFLQKHLAAGHIGARVRSAGTHAGTIDTDPDAVWAMKRHGIDINTHLPRLLTRTILANEGADLVITMTREQLRAVAVMGEGAFVRAFTVRELARRVFPMRSGESAGDTSVQAWLHAVSVGRNRRDLIGDDPDDDVVDSYGLSPAAHLATAAQLDQCTADITRALSMWSG